MPRAATGIYSLHTQRNVSKSEARIKQNTKRFYEKYLRVICIKSYEMKKFNLHEICMKIKMNLIIRRED